MFCADQKLFKDLKFTKQGKKTETDIPIQFLYFALNEENGGIAEGVLEFSEQVYSSVVHDALAELGAASINITTFQNNDGNHSAASALNRVRSVAKTDGFVEAVRGDCNAKLMDKANELLALEEQAPSNEFDAKTQAAIVASLEETKEGLSQVNTSISQMQEKITSAADYDERLVMSDKKLCRTENKLDGLAEYSGRQTYTLNQLNIVIKKKDAEIARLNELIEQKSARIEQKDQYALKVAEEKCSIVQDLQRVTEEKCSVVQDLQRANLEMIQQTQQYSEADKEKDQKIRMLTRHVAAQRILLGKRTTPESK